MLKIKISAIAIVLILVAIGLSSSQKFSTSAEGDVFEEIAGYKNWSKINKDPIKVEFQIDGVSGDENIFIVDGQEVTNFRTGQLNG